MKTSYITNVKNHIFKQAHIFSSQNHGSTSWGDDSVYVMGDEGEYIPFSYLLKNDEKVSSVSDLQKVGFLFSSLEYLGRDDFAPWYKEQFGKKLLTRQIKEVGILYFPNQKQILEALTLTDQAFAIFKGQNVLMNGKNLPVQLGEWFAKSVFGLRQIKSSSQRGFDFYTNDKKRVEVKIHWNDKSSPKGVKIKKSLLELSDYTIVMYVSKNFMIRDILFLDSHFVMRKLSSKGHTIFLKDPDVSKYFFSNSDKHLDKVVDFNTLMRFSSPNFAIKLSDYSS